MKRISFARVCIEINASCDLVDSFNLFMGDSSNPKLGENGEILVEYQWKPKICTVCKSFGHSITNCPKLKPLLSPSENVSAPKLKQEWKRVNKQDAPLVFSPQACMEPPLFGSLKDDEVISTCNIKNEPSLCPTNRPNHDQCEDLSMEMVIDTSNKFAACIEDCDYGNAQCNDQSNDQCNDVDPPSMASLAQCNGQWLFSPTESSTKKKKKKQNAKKERLITRKLSHSLGRFWVGWDPRILNITKISETDQIIYCNACILDTNDQFRISFVYGSNDDRLRKAFWQSMCSSQHGSPWIVLGDFSVSRSVSESIGGCSRISGGIEQFNDCLQSSELHDLRFSGFLHTLCNKRNNGCISRKLDIVLVNNDWLVKLENSKVIFLPPSISDHCPSVVKLGLQGIKKNRPFNIFNYLTDKADFLLLVERCWREQVHGTMQYKLCSKHQNLKKVLKTLKNYKVGDLTIKSIEAKSALYDFQCLFDQHPLDSNLRIQEKELISRYTTTLKDEENLLRQKSRIQWLKAGDRNSSYFFKSIIGKSNRSKIHTITGDDGSLIDGDILVKKEAIRHFQTILGCLRPVSHGIASTLSNIIDKVISIDQAYLMGREVITNEEICDVCFSLHPNKAPGPYGFNAHFFKITWNIVGEDVISALQEFFRSGLLLKELNATILALVPKVPNPSKIKDFRPISFCNTLYKIIAKIIANRIKPCLTDIISSSQLAFVAGRSIGDNILLVQELMRNYHKNVCCPKLALKVDLMKAFDMVD
ncbi:hypothetical protein Dsin_018616 [Dipteronia sinensis]|uniref:Reverse transcriptase domain-containing protein n=1 Tax=Dipteronia sinensis TaxID=43782 RepID=A0AAE0A5M4_9ROSI|nr:hypothetical protein Dsin_018616 [Dipteronia sinensis]